MKVLPYIMEKVYIICISYIYYLIKMYYILSMLYELTSYHNSSGNGHSTQTIIFVANMFLICVIVYLEPKKPLKVRNVIANLYSGSVRAPNEK